MQYIYAMEYYSATKKNENSAISSNMDEPRDFHNEQSESDRERHMISLIYGIFLKGTNEFIYETEIESQRQKMHFWLPEGKGERDKLGD